MLKLTLSLALGLAVSGTAQAQDSATVIVARANVRVMPHSAAPVVAVLDRGTVVQTAGTRAKWTRVLRGRTAGWVRDDLIAIRSRSEESPARAVASVLTPAEVTPAPTPAAETARVALAPSANVDVVDDWNYRDPSMARGYALLWPGIGHLYTGERLKGLALSLGTAAVLYAGVGKLVTGDCGSGMFIIQYPKCAPLHTGVALAAYVYGIVDADKSAGRVNRRRGLVGALARLQPVIRPSIDHPTEFGLAVSLR